MYKKKVNIEKPHFRIYKNLTFRFIKRRLTLKNLIFRFINNLTFRFIKKLTIRFIKKTHFQIYKKKMSFRFKKTSLSDL